MKRLLLVAFLLAALPASAQEIWYPNQNQVFITIDHPPRNIPRSLEYGVVEQMGWWWQTAGSFYLSGWAFNCNGSAPLLTLWRYDTAMEELVQVPATVYTGLYRPDIPPAYAGVPCTVTAYGGWAIYPTVPLPLGPQYLTVHGYSEGGTWNPNPPYWFIVASRYDDRFIIFSSWGF